MSEEEINVCKKILNMIDKNNATLDEVKSFCENFIKTKEVQDDTAAE